MRLDQVTFYWGIDSRAQGVIYGQGLVTISEFVTGFFIYLVRWECVLAKYWVYAASEYFWCCALRVPEGSILGGLVQRVVELSVIPCAVEELRISTSSIPARYVWE